MKKIGLIITAFMMLLPTNIIHAETDTVDILSKESTIEAIYFDAELNLMTIKLESANSFNPDFFSYDVRQILRNEELEFESDVIFFQAEKIPSSTIEKPGAFMFMEQDTINDDVWDGVMLDKEAYKHADYYRFNPSFTDGEEISLLPSDESELEILLRTNSGQMYGEQLY